MPPEAADRQFLIRVIEVFDDFVPTIDGPTVVVLDNASMHRSGAFEEAAERWAEAGLFIYYLSPYSPELNPIERFWRLCKHTILPPAAWSRFERLVDELTVGLKQFGEVIYLTSMKRFAEEL